MNHVPPRFFGGLAFAPAFALRLPSFIARLKGNREFWTRTRWLGDKDSNHDYRSQSRFPGPPWGALTRLPTSPGETLGLRDMEDSFQVTCPIAVKPLNSSWSPTWKAA